MLEFKATYDGEMQDLKRNSLRLDKREAAVAEKEYELTVWKDEFNEKVRILCVDTANVNAKVMEVRAHEEEQEAQAAELEERERKAAQMEILVREKAAVVLREVAGKRVPIGKGYRAIKPPRGTFTMAYIGAQLDPVMFNVNNFAKWSARLPPVEIRFVEGAAVGDLKYCMVHLTNDNDEKDIMDALDFYFEYDNWSKNVQAYGFVVLAGDNKVKELIKTARENGTSWSWKLEDFLAECNGEGGAAASVDQTVGVI
jgi:hypothetical protein